MELLNLKQKISFFSIRMGLFLAVKRNSIQKDLFMPVLPIIFEQQMAKPLI